MNLNQFSLHHFGVSEGVIIIFDRLRVKKPLAQFVCMRF